VTRKIIAVDIDDVLADNAKGFAEFSNSRWGGALTQDDYDEHWARVWGVSEREARQRADIFHREGAVVSYSHNESATTVLRKLRKKYQLVIVTSRRRSIEVHTNEWIHRHYPGIFSEDTIHFAGIWDGEISQATNYLTKGDLCASLGVHYLIDDQLKHCVAVAERGMSAILYGDYTWNRSDTLAEGVMRLNTWQQIGEYFDGRND